MAKVIVFKNKRADGKAFVELLISLIEAPESGWEIYEKSSNAGSEGVTFYLAGRDRYPSDRAFAHTSLPNQIFVPGNLVGRIKKLLKDYEDQVLIVID